MNSKKCNLHDFCGQWFWNGSDLIDNILHVGWEKRGCDISLSCVTITIVTSTY